MGGQPTPFQTLLKFSWILDRTYGVVSPLGFAEADRHGGGAFGLGADRVLHPALWLRCGCHRGAPESRSVQGCYVF